MKLTYKLLVANFACFRQREEFKRLFPQGCQPTVENLMLLSAHGLDAWWLADRFLDRPQSNRFHNLVTKLSKNLSSVSPLYLEIENAVLSPMLMELPDEPR